MGKRQSWPLIASGLLAGGLFLAACSGQGSRPGGSQSTPAGQATDVAALTPRAMQWSSPPAMAIDPGKSYLAVFSTAQGEFTVELFADKAPNTVNNFVFLARQGFYDNTTFHRVLEGFMAQGGDPTGTGRGGSGYRFEDEFHAALQFDQAGYLAMANAGPNTNGSQFFITFAPTPWLNGAHTIFGRVVEGMPVVLSLRTRDPSANPGFQGDALLSVLIEEREPSSSADPPDSTGKPAGGDGSSDGLVLGSGAPSMQAGRPLASLEVSARENIFSAAPEIVIDRNAEYLATIVTTKGTIVMELRPRQAPVAVNNFVVLASLGFYDGFPIVDVEPDTFLVTGSPSGSTLSDIGYTLSQEQSLSNTAGAISFWYRQDNLTVSGSQLMIVLRDIPEFDQFFSVFGYVSEGLEIARSLTPSDTIERIVITEDGLELP